MTFCPLCGVPLKQTTPTQSEHTTTATSSSAAQEPNQGDDNTEENREENKKQESAGKQEKADRGFLGYLIGGLVLITIGAFAVMQISSPATADTGQNWAIMLFLIGIIIIISAVYMAITARYHPRTAQK
jgi:predicted membrane channel-forming protein YqfA (hemolysin III family)